MPPVIIDDLTAAVTKMVTVAESATALIAGIAKRIDDAVAAAILNGATAEQLAPVADLSVALSGASDDLAAAVEANTPAATV